HRRSGDRRGPGPRIPRRRRVFRGGDGRGATWPLSPPRRDARWRRRATRTWPTPRIAAVVAGRRNGWRGAARSMGDGSRRRATGAHRCTVTGRVVLLVLLLRARSRVRHHRQPRAAAGAAVAGAV